MFQDKLTREIAAAAAQIKTEPPKNEVNTKSVEGAVVSVMANEELKGNQHKIDANKNGKVDAHDFKLLRGKKKVEEGVKGAGVGAALGSVAGGPVGAAIGGALGHVAGEVLSSAKNKTKAIGRIIKGPSMADSKMKREETEQLDELMGKGKLPSIASYHKEKGAEAKYHSTQEKRAKSLMKREGVEIEVYDADEINGVQIDNIEERSMTDAEMDKREEIVKSMKKGIQGFKDRYGDKAKNVMYATATKLSKKD